MAKCRAWESSRTADGAALGVAAKRSKKNALFCCGAWKLSVRESCAWRWGSRGGEGTGHQGIPAAGAPRDVAIGEAAKVFAKGELGRGRGSTRASPGDDCPGRIEADVTDLVEAGGQDVSDEPAEELRARHGCAVGTTGANGDGVAEAPEDAVVGERNAMGVAAEVFDDVLGTAKGALGVDVPILSTETRGEASKGFGIIEVVEALELALGVCVSERCAHFAAEHASHRLDGEEIGLARRVPDGTRK